MAFSSRYCTDRCRLGYRWIHISRGRSRGEHWCNCTPVSQPHCRSSSQGLFLRSPWQVRICPLSFCVQWHLPSSPILSLPHSPLLLSVAVPGVGGKGGGAQELLLPIPGRFCMELGSSRDSGGQVSPPCPVPLMFLDSQIASPREGKQLAAAMAAPL